MSNTFLWFWHICTCRIDVQVLVLHVFHPHPQVLSVYSLCYLTTGKTLFWLEQQSMQFDCQLIPVTAFNSMSIFPVTLSSSLRVFLHCHFALLKVTWLFIASLPCLCLSQCANEKHGNRLTQIASQKDGDNRRLFFTKTSGSKSKFGTSAPFSFVSLGLGMTDPLHSRPHTKGRIESTRHGWIHWRILSNVSKVHEEVFFSNCIFNILFPVKHLN